MSYTTKHWEASPVIWTVHFKRAYREWVWGYKHKRVLFALMFWWTCESDRVRLSQIMSSTGVVSSEGLSGQSVRRPFRSEGIWMVSPPCAFSCASWAHLILQTSSCSHPNYICRVFLQCAFSGGLSDGNFSYTPCCILDTCNGALSCFAGALHSSRLHWLARRDCKEQ